MGDGAGTGLLGGSGEIQVADDHFSRAEGFPQDLAPKMGKFTDVGALAKSYVDLEARMGRSISLPKDDATPEDRAEQLGKIYDKLGRKKPEDYEIKKPDKLPPGVQWSEDLETKVRVLANKAGWNNEQLQGALDLWNELTTGMVKKSHDAQNVAAEQAAQQLKQKWGDVKYEVNMTAADQAFLKIVPEPLQELFKTHGLHNDARFVEWMFDIFQEKLAENNLVTGETPGQAATQKILNYTKMNQK